MKLQRSLFVTDVSSSHNRSKSGSFLWRREHRRHGRASSDNEPRNLPRSPPAVVHDTMEKGYVMARETVADDEAAQSVFTAQDIKPAVIDFFLAELWQLKKTRNLQVTKLEWSA